MTSSACDAESLDSADDGAVVELDGWHVERASYRLDWAWGTAQPLGGGLGWSLTTDLGYDVEITRAWLTTYGVALVPCPDLQDEGPLAVVENWLLPTAYAADSGQTDPSSIDEPRVENFTEPGVTEFGTSEFHAATYCRVHVLSAAAPDDARSDVDGEFERVTVLLEGRWRAASSAEWMPLSVDSSLANGAFLELPTEAYARTVEAGTIDITITRALDTLLDGIEFAEATSREVEQQILLNLMHDVSLAVVEPELG